MLARFLSPFRILKGKLHLPATDEPLDTYLNRHAGQILKRESPHQKARTFTEQQIMDIHKLTGQKHSEDGQTIGHFLKIVTPTTFNFEPHGLTAADVGALPLHGTADAAANADTLDGQHAAAFLGATAQAADSDKLDGQHAAAFLGATAQAADSDKLDGQHASAFEPAISAPADATKVWDGTKAFRFNDRLCASNGSPTAAIQTDAAGHVGIGTAAPAAPLHILKDYNAAHTAIIENPNAGNGAYTEIQARRGNSAGFAARLMVMGAGYTTSGGFLADAAILCASEYLTQGLNIMTRYAGSPIRFYVGSHNVEVARLTSTGRLGIMNTNPGYPLDVTGEINTSTNLKTNGSTRIDVNGDATLGNCTSTGYNIPRWRGAGPTLPTTDLRNGDLYGYEDPAAKGIAYYHAGHWYKYDGNALT